MITFFLILTKTFSQNFCTIIEQNQNQQIQFQKKFKKIFFSLKSDANDFKSFFLVFKRKDINFNTVIFTEEKLT